MSKSIYELECENLQLNLLERKASISFKQAKEHIECVKRIFSKECINMYEFVISLAFETSQNTMKSCEELIKVLKDKDLKGFELECALEEVSYIYEMTFEEVRDFYEGKKYWMSIGRIYENYKKM